MAPSLAIEKSLAERTVLFLHDDPAILDALTATLRGENWQILAADSPSAAFELLARNTVQLVVSDQHMPEMRGIEFLDLVSERYPDTIRILLSGDTQPECLREAIERGTVHDFLAKPWNHEKLMQILEGGLNRFAKRER